MKEGEKKGNETRTEGGGARCRAVARLEMSNFRL